jgi:hypothetical protein
MSTAMSGRRNVGPLLDLVEAEAAMVAAGVQATLIHTGEAGLPRGLVVPELDYRVTDSDGMVLGYILHITDGNDGDEFESYSAECKFIAPHSALTKALSDFGVPEPITGP